mgnify:CR=1 FL=1
MTTSSSTEFGPLAVCVLAAGKGTRMRSARPKVLQPLAGAPLLEHVLRAVAGAAGRLAVRPLVVPIIGYEAEQVRALLESPEIVGLGLDLDPVVQEPQLGTGHAVQVASRAFSGLVGQTPPARVLVLLGDVPLIRAETLEGLFEEHARSGAAATILTTRVPDPAGYGRVVRAADGDVERIVEHKDALAAGDSAVLAIDEINTGIFVFDLDPLQEALPALSNENQSNEYYLPDVLPRLQQAGHRVAAVVAAQPAEVAGVNDLIQLAEAEAAVRQRILFAHMRAGVRIVDPTTTYIEVGVEIGPETTILPFTVIRRGVRIGQSCEVGPFSHLRVGTQLRDTAEIGNFVETKKADVGPHSKAKHLAYLGDVSLGEGVNVGAGTVFANYDGKNKHQTRVEDGVFIGSGSMIVAPRVIERDAKTGAGSVVTKDVPAGVTVIGVPARPFRSAKRSEKPE